MLQTLDDFSYVARDQAETSVLFELIAARYERKSLLVTANQPLWRMGQAVPQTLGRSLPQPATDLLIPDQQERTGLLD